MLASLSSASRHALLLLRSLGAVRPARTSYLRVARRLHLHGGGSSSSMEEPVVVVRCLPGEPKLTISFTLDGSHKHMQREQGEELGKVLARIANNILKGQGKAKKSKKNRRQQQAEEAELTVVKVFLTNGEAASDGAANCEAWQDGGVLHIGELRYTVRRNAPTFTTAELPASLLAGFPACPKLEVEFGQLRDCEFTWFREGGAAEASATPGGVAQQQQGGVAQQQQGGVAQQQQGGVAQQQQEEEERWEEVGRRRVYVPDNLDIGSRLRLRCSPRDGARAGPHRDLVSTGAVEAGPGACTFDNRHMYTLKGTGDGSRVTRVVSYNILADIYAQTELSKTVLYPYCAPYALGLDYRQNLIKKELAGYNADVVCLQEVDKGVFTDSLVPALDAFGLDGVFKIKEKQHEGLATFYRRSKLRLLSQHDVMLSKALTSDPIHAELLERLSTSPVLRDKILQRSTTLQVSVLEELNDSSRKICVANTHLYWHPKGGNTRLVQIGVALRHLSHVISELSPGTTLIFCGDFNSTPSSGLFHLITQGSVSDSHPDWSSSGEEEACPMEMRCPLPPLLSACGEPAYTNYVGGFHGCLDYVFMESEHMEVDQVIPLPSHQEVTTYQALPSVAHPSDHIALVCDLRWKSP